MGAYDTKRAERQALPLVSVIIPTYNRAALLPEALDSVYAQEGAGECFEMQVLVVDDASPDATPQVMQHYPAVHYIRLATNQGESGARNAGIQASRGKYVAFLDDDDLWLPHRLRVQVPVLEDHPEVGVVYGQNIVRGEGIENPGWPDAHRAPSGNVFQAFLLEDFISINTVLVRREAFEKAGYFDESLQTVQYYDMCLRLAFHVPFAFVPGSVAIQRYSRAGNWTATVVGGVYERTHTYVVERALAMLPDTPEYVPVKQRAHAALFAEIAKNLAAVADRGWIDFERLHAHLLTGLRTFPWMVTASTVRRTLLRSARLRARTSASPIAAIRTFCAEIRAAAGRPGLRQQWALRQLLAEMWTEVANEVAADSHSASSAARYAVAYAFFYNPVHCARKFLARLRERVALRAHADRILGLLKHSRS